MLAFLLCTVLVFYSTPYLSQHIQYIAYTATSTLAELARMLLLSAQSATTNHSQRRTMQKNRDKSGKLLPRSNPHCFIGDLLASDCGQAERAHQTLPVPCLEAFSLLSGEMMMKRASIIAKKLLNCIIEERKATAERFLERQRPYFGNTRKM